MKRSTIAVLVTFTALAGVVPFLPDRNTSEQTPKVDPIVEVATPEPKVGSDEELANYIGSLPFSHLLPEFPFYDVPTIRDCDWIVRGGVAVSQNGLGRIEGQYPIGLAYQVSLAAGNDFPTFGIFGDAGTLGICQGYHLNVGGVVYRRENGQYVDAKIKIVGLDPNAEITLTWGDKYGFAERIELYNIGFRHPSDSFTIRTVGNSGHIILDGCWWVTRRDLESDEVSGASGLHLSDYKSLIVRRHRWRGRTPSEPGINLREHSFYIKSSTEGPTWIVQSDLRGGNRTWFQRRPGNGQGNVRPAGPFMVMLNRGDGYGWNHGMSGGSFDGGSAITIWTAPDDNVFIAGNKILDAKYGCLMIGAQPQQVEYQGQILDLNWYNENGFPIQTVWIWDNDFENSQVGRPANLPRRSAVAISAVETLHLGPNQFLNGAELVINNQWAMIKHGIKVGRVLVHSPSLLRLPIRTYGDTSNGRLFTREEKLMWLADLPEPK